MPDTLIYNDLPDGLDTDYPDSLILHGLVNDNNDAALPGIDVTFTNLTPDYGTLDSSVVETNSDGIAINRLKNIDTEAFDYENQTSDIITIQIDVIDSENVTRTDTESAIITPLSINNIYKVNDFDFLVTVSKYLPN